MSRFIGARILVLVLVLPVACGAPRRTTATDDLGRAVDVPPHAARIITLAPNLTEIVAYAGGASRLVGTDSFSNFPSSVASLPKVGGVHVDVEQIAKLHPDLILISTSSDVAAVARQIESLHVPLFAVKTDRLSDVGAAIEHVATILGDGDGDGRERRRRFEESIARQRRKRVHPPSVLFVVWTDPLIVAGQHNFVDDLFAVDAARNAASGALSAWPQYSLESVVASPPDLILYPEKAIRPEVFRAFVENDPRWKMLDAVKRERYVAVDDDVFTRPGPRLVEAAAQLNSILDRIEREP